MSTAFRTEPLSPDGAATITLCRPDEGNVLAPPDMLELGAAIEQAGSDPAAKLVVIRAEGEHFCLGRKPSAPPATPPSALQLRERVTKPILAVYAHLRATPVPVVAVVQGEARGFGCAFVGQCDLAIAADTAIFSLPEMDNNLPPTLAISAMLHKIPPKRLTHLVMTRETFTAAEALAFDVVSKVVARADLEQEAAAYIADLASRNRRALAAIKEYMGTAPYIDPQAAARLGANLLATVFSSREEA